MQAKSDPNALVRTIVVITLSLVVIGLTLPNLWTVGHLANYAPIGIDLHYDVVSIVPGSDVEKAGLRLGDRVDPRSLAPIERLALNTGVWSGMKPGEVVRFVAERNGSRFPIELRMPPTPPAGLFVAVIKRGTATFFILVAAMLVLLRPSKTTWGFFFYALGSAQGAALVMVLVSPTAAAVASTLLVAVFYFFLGPLGLLMFTTTFPTPSKHGLRKAVERVIPVFGVLLGCTSVAFLLYVLGIAMPDGSDLAVNVIDVGALVFAFVALFAGFRDLAAAQRQRLRWVAAAFVIYIALTIYSNVSPFLPSQGWPVAWYRAGFTSDVLNGLAILIPLSVAYAVLKHHVLDVNFVIGRGLVYGIVTSIAIAAFAIVDWFLTRVLAQTKLALVGEILAAVAIGFWLNGLHSHVDRFVDAFIFRKRHAAEQRLAQAAAGLPHAESYDAIAGMMVREPVEALGLRSAAFFRLRDSGDFVCDNELNVPSFPGATIGPNDPLVIHLQGARAPVILQAIGWKPRESNADADPVIAFPVFIRHELHAFALYGGHATGEAIDPDERRMLQQLCSGAAAAIDHSAAAELRRRLDEALRARGPIAQPAG